MKKPFPLFLLILLLAAGVHEGYAQVNRDAYIKREASYKALITDLHTVRNTQLRDTVKPTTSVKIASLYLQHNIYPTKGSVALVYRLNPELDASKPVPASYRLRVPHFTPAPRALLLKSQQEFAILKVPNAAENEKFLSLSKVYDQDLANLHTMIWFSAGLNDTTEVFRSTILPGINKKAEVICQAQMQYFNTELRHITRLMEDILSKQRKAAELIYSINQMIGDFMEITGWGQKKMEPHGGPRSASARLAVDPSLYTAWDNPPNADIYVFKRDKNGNVDSLPSMNAYDVYYDSNGFIFSLTPGCDTVSFFSYHPRNPASTLPVILGKGNYCFVLKDRKTGQIYLQPDINLAVDARYDEKNRVIIPFFLEED